MIEGKKRIVLQQEHIEALIESEKQEAIGNTEYVAHKELKNHIKKIFADFNVVKGTMVSNS